MVDMDPQEIYDNFHKNPHGTDSLLQGHDGTNDLSGSYTDRARQIQKLVDGMNEGWQGQAADQATQAMNPAVVNFHEGAEDLANAQGLLSRQVDSWHTAKNSVQPVPPEPSLQNPLTVLNPTPMLEQQAKYIAAGQSNVDAMHTYSGASTYNGANLPPFEPALPPPGGKPTITRPEQQAATNEPAAHHGPAVSAKPPKVRGASAAHGPVSEPTTARGSVNTPPPTLTSGATSGSAASTASVPGRSVGSMPSMGTNPPAENGIPAGGSSYPGAGWSDEQPIPGGPNGDIAARLGGNPAGGSNSNIAARLAGGSAAGGSDNLGGRGSSVPGAGRPGESESGGPRSGAGGSGADGQGARGGIEEMAGERAATAGQPGQGGQGMMGGGRGGKGGQDTEHKRKYVRGEDPEKLFAGDLPPVAPEAVGETLAEERARHARGQ